MPSIAWLHGSHNGELFRPSVASFFSLALALAGSSPLGPLALLSARPWPCWPASLAHLSAPTPLTHSPSLSLAVCSGSTNKLPGSAAATVCTPLVPACANRPPPLPVRRRSSTHPHSQGRVKTGTLTCLMREVAALIGGIENSPLGSTAARAERRAMPCHAMPSPSGPQARTSAPVHTRQRADERAACS